MATQNSGKAALASDGFWRNRNVFVTGCTGLLGSWLAKGLVDKGANVTGLVRDLVPNSNLNRFSLQDRMCIVRGELEDYQTLERVLNEYEIEAVFHIAAQAIVGAANRNPLATFEANIRGTYNLLEACRRNSKLVQRIVVASSDKAYGEHETLPYTENFALQGQHPYDVSKSCTDLLCSTYAKSYELPVCITRCGNIYGGGDLNFNRIIPGTIQWTLNGEQTIIRSDGKFVRDYIYVDDIVDAYLFLAAKIEPAIYGEAFNFSNDKPVNVIELVNEILQLMGRPDLEPLILNQASNEIRNQYLSSEKARTQLGWQPQYSLEEGLLKTIDWYKDFLQQS